MRVTLKIQAPLFQEQQYIVMNQLQIEANNIELSLSDLTSFAQYLRVGRTIQKSSLTVNDSHVNSRQKSQYYIKRRKENANNKVSKMAKQQEPQKAKQLVKIEKSQLKSIFYQATSVKKNKEAPIQDAPDLTTIKKEPLSKTSSRKKIQIVQKPQSLHEITKLNNSETNFKPYEKQYLEHYQSQLNLKTCQRVDLSEFMHTQKLDQTFQNRSVTYKKPKQQKCASNKVRQKQKKQQIVSMHEQKNLQQQNINMPINQQIIRPNQAYQSPIFLPSFSIGPERISKSRSKSKIKDKKQSSFKKNVKVANSYVLPSQNLETNKAEDIIKSYSAVHKAPQKTVKQTSIFSKRINTKCQDREPVQIIPSSNPSLNEQKQHDRPQHEQIPEENQNLLNFYSIDLKLISKPISKPQDPSMIILKSQIRSEKQKGDSNQEAQKTEVQQKQEQKTSRKYQRRKIFQSAPVKAPEVTLDVRIDNLNEQEMKMLLGAQGNKYKQAIVLQFIRENRRQQLKSY